MNNKRFLLISIIAAVIVFNLPTLIGWLLTPAGHQFQWSSGLNPGDPSVYYSYIEQGRQGHFAMYDAFTSEKQTFPILQPWWWLVGQVADLTGVGAAAIYSIFRLALIPWLAVTLWWAAGWVFSSNAERRMGYLLTLFGGGIGGLLAWVYAPQGIQSYPDLWVAEIYPALIQLSSPHFLIVTIGILLTIVGIEKSWTQSRWTTTWLAAAGALVVTILHPFHVVTWLVYVFVRALTVALNSPRRLMGYLGRWAMVAICSLPAFAWYGLQLSSDPLAQARAEQNNNITWPIPQLLIVLGATLPLALITWRRRRMAQPVFIPVATMAAAYVVAIYLPFDWQRRLSHGLFVPFAWLAAPTLWAWWQSWLNRWRIWGVALVGLTALLFVVSPAWTVGAVIRDYHRELLQGQRYVYYLSPEQQQLIQAIRQETSPRQPLLASITLSRVIAGLTAQQVYIGHVVETVHFSEKLAKLKMFYSLWSMEQQQLFLRGEHLCYVVDGPRERAYGNSFHPEQWADLKKIWSGPTTQLYRLSSCL